MTALNAPMPMSAPSPNSGLAEKDFVDRLSHPQSGYGSSPAIALFASFISFGLLPLVIWPARWAAFLDSERGDLLDLVVWWRRRVDIEDAEKIDQIATHLRARPILMVLPWLAAGFNAIVMILLFAQGDAIARLWDLTFRFNQHWVFGRPLESHLHATWIAGLCFGYGCQWYAVRSHAMTVHSLVRWTNRLAKENGFTRIRNESLRVGLNPLWVGAAILLCSLHAWWGIPMVFAGALQRRYSMESSSAIRIALAGQVQDGFALNTFDGEKVCSRNDCGHRLPKVARFCSRCGTAV